MSFKIAFLMLLHIALAAVGAALSLLTTSETLLGISFSGLAVVVGTCRADITISLHLVVSTVCLIKIFDGITAPFYIF